MLGAQRTQYPIEAFKKTLGCVGSLVQAESDQRSAYIFQDVGGELATDILEQAGVDEMSVGEVSLSEQDLNFLVTEPGADSSQVLELIEQVKQAVNEKTGIELQTAICLW